MNVLGAIEALTNKLTTVINDTTIDACCVVDLIGKIALQDWEIPKTIILDNARYQYCEMVKLAAKYYNVELLYLPSYSPNLNIIERLWKWIKKDCLYCKYYSKFCEFKSAISNSLDKCQHLAYKEEMASLFSLKFQLYDNTQIMTL
jgi:transposase